MHACNQSRPSIVNFLLDCDADVNAKNSANETALIWLCGRHMG